MIGFKAKALFNARPVQRKVNQTKFTNLRHAAGAIRLTARRSIREHPKPSLPGTPPHTQTRLLKESIVYRVDDVQRSVLVGPDATIIGPIGCVHEFGGLFRGRRYPARPFMGPAVQKNIHRLPKLWAGSIK